MSKEDLFDLIIKGFGVYLLILAIIAIPKAIEGISMLAFLSVFNPFSGSEEKAAELASTIRSACISGSIGAAAKFVIYIIASASLLRSGALVKKLMGKKKISKENNQNNK